MKRIAIIFFLLFAANATFAQGMRQAFLTAFASEDTTLINRQLTLLSGKSESITKAASGALLMKKSAYVFSNRDKLRLFTEGRKLLDQAIKEEPENSAFRFLRLAIQENVPAILRYKQNIKEDSEIVIKNYTSLSPDLKRAVLDYSRSSEALKEKLEEKKQ